MLQLFVAFLLRSSLSYLVSRIIGNGDLPMCLCVLSQDAGKSMESEPTIHLYFSILHSHFSNREGFLGWVCEPCLLLCLHINCWGSM